MMKNLLQSFSAFHRVLFVDLVALATEKFSVKFFNSLFSNLLFSFVKEKQSLVAIAFARKAVKFARVIGQIDMEQVERLIEIINHYIVVFSSCGQYAVEILTSVKTELTQLTKANLIS